MYRIAVTNRGLCEGDYGERIRMIASGQEYDAVLLREKDLTEREYMELAKRVLSICEKYGKKCILHSFADVALELKHPCIHLPLPALRGLPPEKRERFSLIGTSVHSKQQAEEAEKYGVSYMVAGHIFETDCKRDKPPRGLLFLREICAGASVPVYAIGGITREREPAAAEQGAAGVCVMSGAMRG